MPARPRDPVSCPVCLRRQCTNDHPECSPPRGGERPRQPRKYRASPQPRKLTDEQAREIRLSPESNGALARRFDVAVDSIIRIRAGRNYGPLRDDERQAQRTRKAAGRPRDPIGGPQAWRLADNLLLIGPSFPVIGRPDLQDQFEYVEGKDAADECAHGRLPHDSTDPCGCWPQEITKTNPITQQQEDHHVSDAHGTRLERFASQAARTGAADHQPAHA